MNSKRALADYLIWVYHIFLSCQGSASSVTTYISISYKSRKNIKSQDKIKDKKESTDKFEEVYGKDI